MKPTLIRVALIAFALASLLPACAQSDSAVTRVNFCVVTGVVEPDGKVSTTCNVPTTKLDIPSKLSPSMDTSKPYATTVNLFMQLTKSQILDWSKLDDKEEKLTSDMFRLYATKFEYRRKEYIQGFNTSIKTNRYVELPNRQFKNFRQFDLPHCVDVRFEEVSADNGPNTCNTNWQIFIPQSRNNILFACFRPFRSVHGYAIDRWCHMEAEIAPDLIVSYLLKRSAVESGDWIDIDQRVRVFFQAMLVKE